MITANELSQIKFWSLSQEDLFQKLSSQKAGLSPEEAKKRLKIFGANRLEEKKKTNVVLSFFSKFLNPLILILLFASLISAFLGELSNFFIILIIILISAGIDFYQQFNAENAAEKLKQRVSLKAEVIRSGLKQEILASEIVPGDMIFLSAGDLVPADCRIISSRELTVSESSLTGESYPVEKQVKTLNDSSSLSERINSVFLGTSVLSGEAEALVIKTGTATEFGKLAEHLIEKRPKTEFETGIEKFGFLLAKITLILVILVFFVNAFFKHDILNSFLFALALAVGLTPELLPVIVTINLAKGASRMAKKEVIVKDLPAIQNFGSMNVLCTDKTGTLTEDKIKLERYEDLSGQENDQVLLYGFLNSHFQTGLKSPLEKAVLTHEVNLTGFEKIDEVPFDFIRKRLSVIVKKGRENLLITKGAPENILPHCSHVFLKETSELTEKNRQKILERFKDLSSEGYRVLAVAYKKIESQKTYNVDDEKNLTFLGLMAFLDPPKESAKEALSLLENAGVTLKILTGDNEIVTQKVCQELGLNIEGVMLGEEIEKLTDLELEKKMQTTNIFARLNPDQKQRIILSLKKAGNVTGFLGDGINDAPSLREADIGISVQNAVDIAKESADLILLRKDLHVLKDGVLEGRKTYGNIMKYIQMGTSSNFGNMFSVAGASLFLPFLPMLPIQILLNNLLYDVSQLTVFTDNVDPEYLQTPKKWDLKFIRHFMLIFGPISSIFDFATFFILLFIFRATVPLFQTGWFVESLVTQTLIIFSIRTVVSPFFKSWPSTPLIISSLGVALAGSILPFSPLAQIFSFAPPPLKFYLLLILLIALYLLIVEKTKVWFFHKYLF